jgi:hypothetical protein
MTGPVRDWKGIHRNARVLCEALWLAGFPVASTDKT